MEPTGVLALFSKHAISDEEDSLLESVASTTAQVIQIAVAEEELRETHHRLIETSHQAGMAEVAADVLHNVGNVLNSINVSTTLITDKIVNSEIENLRKVVGLINDNAEDLGRFLTENQQGKHIPEYLTEVAKCLSSEQTDLVSRLRTLSNNVQHIKDIIGVQQSYAKTAGVEVQASLARLVEDAIQINSAGLERHGARIVRELDELADVNIDKQKVIQILVNLINNAKYALSSSNKEEKLLTIRVHRHDEHLFRIEVADNGTGISQANMTKIFSHGFTTKQHGHGFGLHSSALAAKDMRGSLTVHSNGAGQGATFTLELPFKPVEVIK
jgi:signal transduction histidine kinase